MVRDHRHEKARCGRRRPFAFTLLEMIVTVAIIALLIAILSSSLVKARSAVRGFVCKNKLKTVAFEFNLFADDLVLPEAPDGLGTSGNHFRIETFQERLYRINHFWDLRDQAEADYEPSRQPLMCPAGPQELRRRAGLPCSKHAVGPPENVSMCFNMRLDKISVRIEDRWVLQDVALTGRILEHPSVPLAFDVDGAAAKEKRLLPYYAAPPAGDPGIYGTGLFWHPSLRHDGKLNAAFIGGHVLSSCRPETEPGWDWAYQPPATR